MNQSQPATAYLALGANLGDRRDTLDEALRRLRERGIDVVSVSSFIETDPVGGSPGQGRYLNGAACVRTGLAPRELLDLLLEIEGELGRVRQPGERNEPRTIDLDILFYGDRIIEEEGLCVPHPRLHRRVFVLEPLAQIAPEWVHPVLGKSVAELLAGLTGPAK